ncbi:MAG: phosphotransferase family protein [Candidatus Njordarchaeales archaeon]
MEDIWKIIDHVDMFRDNREKVKIINVWRKDNIVVLVDYMGRKYILKDSIKGWGFYEYTYMKLLRLEGYPVPQPINFYPVGDVYNDRWAYGRMGRYRGILVYKYIEGRPLCETATEENIREAINLMHKLHNDARHHRKKPFVPNYKKVESERLLYYLQRVDIPDKLIKKILDLAQAYTEEKIDYVLIHGDYRPQNLIVSDDVIYMIDLEGISDGADKYKDAGIFSVECQKRGFPGIEDLLAKKGYDIGSIRYLFYVVRRLLVIIHYEKNPNYREWALKKIEELLRERFL